MVFGRDAKKLRDKISTMTSTAAGDLVSPKKTQHSFVIALYLPFLLHCVSGGGVVV